MDFHSEFFQHWFWVLTADFSMVASTMKMSPVYSTLYPTKPMKLAGGRYGQCLDDRAIVRILSQRCFICDAILNTSADLFVHHQLAHGNIEPHEAVPEVSRSKVHITQNKHVPIEIDCDFLNTFHSISHATLS